MNDLRGAIETYYNGLRFRSRLEARWAVFFDAAGIEYQYEPQGYKGIGGYYYLPDFYLPRFDVYAEVKGCDVQLKEDKLKLSGILSGDNPIAKAGLIILGEIPFDDYESLPYFDLVFGVGYCNIYKTKCYFNREHEDETGFYHGIMAKEWMSGIFRYERIDPNPHFVYPDLKGISTKAEFISVYRTTLGSINFIIDCYITARQARFEHGETPRINQYRKDDKADEEFDAYLQSNEVEVV